MKQYRLIRLTKNYLAIISAKDHARVSQYSWHVHMSGGTKRKPGYPYARATIEGKKVYLHRFIVSAPDFMQVDHKNHQTLDCRRGNLKICTQEQNLKARRKIGG